MYTENVTGGTMICTESISNTDTANSMPKFVNNLKSRLQVTVILLQNKYSCVLDK